MNQNHFNNQNTEKRNQYTHSMHKKSKLAQKRQYDYQHKQYLLQEMHSMLCNGEFIPSNQLTSTKTGVPSALVDQSPFKDTLYLVRGIFPTCVTKQEIINFCGVFKILNNEDGIHFDVNQINFDQIYVYIQMASKKDYEMVRTLDKTKLHEFYTVRIEKMTYESEECFKKLVENPFYLDDQRVLRFDDVPLETRLTDVFKRNTIDEVHVVVDAHSSYANGIVFLKFVEFSDIENALKLISEKAPHWIVNRSSSELLTNFKDTAFTRAQYVRITCPSFKLDYYANNY